MDEVARALLDHTGGRAIDHRLPRLAEAIEWVAVIAEVGAVAVLTLGAGRFASSVAHGHLISARGAPAQRIRTARASFRLYILAGLDLFIVFDIIHTVISQALADLISIGLLVAIRLVVGVSLKRAAMIDPPDTTSRVANGQEPSVSVFRSAITLWGVRRAYGSPSPESRLPGRGRESFMRAARCRSAGRPARATSWVVFAAPMALFATFAEAGEVWPLPTDLGSAAAAGLACVLSHPSREGPEPCADESVMICQDARCVWEQLVGWRALYVALAAGAPPDIQERLSNDATIPTYVAAGLETSPQRAATGLLADIDRQCPDAAAERDALDECVFILANHASALVDMTQWVAGEDPRHRAVPERN